MYTLTSHNRKLCCVIFRSCTWKPWRQGIHFWEPNTIKRWCHQYIITQCNGWITGNYLGVDSIHIVNLLFGTQLLWSISWNSIFDNDAKDSGAYLESRIAGLTNVTIQCSELTYNLTDHEWGYQVNKTIIIFNSYL